MTIQDVIAGRSAWHVECADSIDVLGAMTDGSVDHIICDPPYSARTHAGARTTHGRKAITIDFDALARFAFVSDLVRVSKRWVAVFCALEQLGLYESAFPSSWVRAGIWDRPDGCPQLTGDRPGQGAEGIAILHREGAKRWNGGGKRAVWTCGVERSGRVHPTQKPLRLMLDLVRDFTDPGDVVCDPYCGSGSTGVACLKLGRRFIGIEKQPHYAEVARERLADVDEAIRAERGEVISITKPRQISLFKIAG